MKRILYLFALIFFHLFSKASFGQGKHEGRNLPYIIEKEDTIYVVNLSTVNIEAEGPDYLKNLQAYYRLRFNVIKVYPYARLVAVKLNEMNRVMSTLNSDREKRRYKNSIEDQVQIGRAHV